VDEDDIIAEADAVELDAPVVDPAMSHSVEAPPVPQVPVIPPLTVARLPSTPFAHWFSTHAVEVAKPTRDEVRSNSVMK
jgi:hypothetical protein